jgi:folate-binding protein YgfZ
MAETKPLGETGASLDDYQAAQTGCALFDLSHRSKLMATGPEAAKFLHNLTTQDVLGLPFGEGREAFALTAKARVVAYFHLFHCKNEAGAPEFHLDLASGTAEKILRHFDFYLISEQVELLDCTRDFVQILLAGPEARPVVERVLGSVPPLEEMQHVDATTRAGVRASLRRTNELNRSEFTIVCASEAGPDLWRRLIVAGARPAGLETFEVLRVEAGTPTFGVDLDEETFAPEVGRTRQAISYTKGCYLGQEPIVMARDRGHINRLLLGLRLTDGPTPGGTLLYREGKEVGRVTSSVVSPRLGPIALAYLRRIAWEPGTAVEVETEGRRRPALVSALPFGE